MKTRIPVIMMLGASLACSSPAKKSKAPEPRAKTQVPAKPAAAKPEKKAMDEKKILEHARKLVEEHTKIHEKLETRVNELWWQSAVNSKSDASKKVKEAELALKKAHSDPKIYAELKKLKDDPAVKKDELLHEQILIMYRSFAQNQIPEDLMKQITDLSTEMDKLFTEFRPVVKEGGKEKKVSYNDIAKVLKEERDSVKRKMYWEASKQIGAAVHDKLLKLVKLRNEAARKLGFKNYHEMSLSLDGQDPKQIAALFDELDSLTREPFRAMKADMDAQLAKYYGVAPDKLMPWHYEDPFFQELPQRAAVKLDPYFKGVKPLEITKLFYKTLGMDVEDILKRSDLFERENKNPHAFCTHIDRKGDIRILANVRDDWYWTSTMLHEMGHAVYDKYIDSGLPYLLREPAHTFTTEGVAMMMQRVIFRPSWLKAALNYDGKTRITDKDLETLAPKLRHAFQLETLIFARWSLVMYNFEKALYENPDQDLEALWWKMVSKYQMVNVPEGREKAFDWATKVHLITVPAYYHNYIIGQMFASQMMDYIARNVVKHGSAADMDMLGGAKKIGEQTEVSLAIGKYLREKVFRPGHRWEWPRYVKEATGEPLSAKAFAEQFIPEKFRKDAKPAATKDSAAAKPAAEKPAAAKPAAAKPAAAKPEKKAASVPPAPKKK